MFVWVFVPSAGTGNLLDWRLLVEECIAKSATLRNIYLDGLDGNNKQTNLLNIFGIVL